MKADLIIDREPLAREPLRGSLWSRCTNLRLRFPTASTGLMSIVDQAVVSGTAFATAAVIGRSTTPDQLGLYYLTLTIVLILVGIQDQIVAVPYMVYVKKYQGAELAHYAGSTWAHHLLLTGATLIALVVAIVCGLVFDWEIVPGLWALLATGPLILLREDIRRFAFADLHLRSALAIDGAVAALQIGGLLLLAYYGQLSLFNIFGVMGAACAVASLGWWLLDRPKLTITPRRAWSDWLHNWSFAKWALQGHLLGSTTPYLMIWIVNLALGPVAAGVLGACTTLIGAAKVIQAGVTNVFTTQSAHAFADGGWPELRRLMIRAGVFLGLSIGAFCVLFWITGDKLAVLVYGEFFQGTGPILVALALATLMSSFSVVLGNGLWAVDKARANFSADVCCTAVTLLAALFLVKPLGAWGAALATLAGNTAATLVRLVLLVRAYESDRLESSPAPVTS